MPKIQIKNGLNIHYQRVGEGPDLVLIHGLTGNLAVWHLKVVPLLRRHYRVLTYDLRGHGYSDMPPTGYTTDDMAEDLGYLLDALEIERPILTGHSYGSDTALTYALLHPERVDRIVAIEPGLSALISLRKREDWEGWRYWSEALDRFGIPVPPERRADADYMLRLSLKVPMLYGPAVGRPRKAEPLLRLLETTMIKDYEVVGALSLDNIEKITTPVQLIYGEGSAFLGSYDHLRQRLPNVTPIKLPPSAWGHFGPVEQPEILVSYVLDYLQPSGYKPAGVEAEVEAGFSASPALSGAAAG
jgi:pimeloyl-ACP methyl ester carboxylesterase